MNIKDLRKVITILIACVWLINGLLCKIMNFVPRHKKIVATILGEEFAGLFTVIIGFSEVIMAIWIVSKFKTRFNAITQIIIVATMNIIEFVLAPDLLLWGKLNSLFALLFILLVYCNEFILSKKVRTASLS